MPIPDNYESGSVPNSIRLIADYIEGGDSHAYDEFPAPPPPPGSGSPAANIEPKRAPMECGSLEAESRIKSCVGEPENDTGNGQRLLRHFGEDLLHVRNIGWHAWAGTHWQLEGGNEIATRYAQKTASLIALEVQMISLTQTERRVVDEASDARATLATLDNFKHPSEEQKAERKRLQATIDAGGASTKHLKARQLARKRHSITSGNAGKIRGMLEQALPHRTVTVDNLDGEVFALNVENGTIRFVSKTMPDPNAPDHSERYVKTYHVEIAKHNRGDNFTKVAPVRYDPDAECPSFNAAVQRFLPVESVRGFIQRYPGYALTGLTGEQCLVFNYGTGSNWKSTSIEIVARIMGPYCATIAFESLAGDQQRSGSQATPDLARLPGTRLVRASEPERGVQFREALIKTLTGGEPMLVRSLNKEFFEFRPTFKMILSGNHKPEIGGVDHGIWRRIRFVHWPTTISDKEKRPMDEVLAELWTERSGILNWLIAGALDYLNGGLQTPQEVIDATAEYREEMDPVGNFVSACIERVAADHPDAARATVTARQMYDAFACWAVANAVRPWKEKGFATARMQKGFLKNRTSSGLRYVNVALQNVPKPGWEGEQAPYAGDLDDVVPL